MNLVLFLDFSNLNLAQRRGVFRALEETLAGETGPVRIMVMTYDRRTAQIPQTFTLDREAVRRVLEETADQNFMVFPDPLLPLFDAVGVIAQQVTRANRITSDDPRISDVQAAFGEVQHLIATLRNTAEERKREIVALVDLLRRVSLSLGGLDGRKALLYVGDRMSLVPGQSVYDEALRVLEDPSIQHTLTDEARLLISQFHSDLNSLNISRDFERFLGEANSVGVTFYTLTPPNLENSSTVERTGGSMPGFQGRVPSALNEEVKTAACMMSGETGGLCQVGGSELTQLLTSAFEDFDAFYTLAFAPGREPDGKLHHIKVKVKDRKLRLRYREVYLNKPRADQAHQRLIAALTFEEEHDPLAMDLRFHPQSAVEDSELFLVPVELRVSTAELALLPEPDGTRRTGRLRLLVASTSGGDRTTQVKEYPLTVNVPEAHFTAGERLPLFAQQIHLKLAPGEQTVAVGLWDEVGRVGSFLHRTITVADSWVSDTAAY